MTDMADRIWILGAADPEMEAIEALLCECGESVVHATAGGVRVHPGNAYRADCPAALTGGMGEAFGAVYRVECAWDPAEESLGCHVHTIDHHRLGDPGYGRPASEFMSASSIGQVISVLAARHGSEHGPLGLWGRARIAAVPEGGSIVHDAGRWCVGVRGTGHGSDGLGDGYARLGTGYARWVQVPDGLVIAAAADHCLGAAYRGECPGVDPDELMRWRVASRARFQGRAEADILADIAAARQALQVAPERFITNEHGDTVAFVRDMRRDTPIPELVEAATRDGVSYVSGPLAQPDGRRKYTVSGTADVVRAWMEHWAPAHGIAGIYGDPVRGFAGGYEVAP